MQTRGLSESMAIILQTIKGTGQIYSSCLPMTYVPTIYIRRRFLSPIMIIVKNLCETKLNPIPKWQIFYLFNNKVWEDDGSYIFELVLIKIEKSYPLTYPIYY